MLCSGQTRVGRLGVETNPKRGLAAAVVAMADGGMIRELKPLLAQILLRGKYGVLGQPRIRRDRQMTRRACNHDFESIRRGTRTEAIMQERGRHTGKEAEERKTGNNEHESSAFHGPMSMLIDERRSSQWQIRRR